MGLRFNPPPGWPPPPEGFVPPPGWQPDPSWPPAPPGWQLWVPDDTVPDAPGAGGEAPGEDRPWASGGGFEGGASGPGTPGSGMPGSETTMTPGQPPAAQGMPGQPYPPYSPGQAYLPGQPYPPGQPYSPGGPPPSGPYSPGGPYPPGQGPYPYPPGGQPPPQGANGFAVASFILGIFGFTAITLVLSVVFGIVALAKIRSRPQRGRGLAIAGLVLSGLWLILLALVIALAVSSQPQRAVGGSVTHKGSVDVFSLRTGDCFQNPSADQALLGVTYVTVVPCTTAHNAQVFVEFPVAGSSYPGAPALQRQADRGCRARIDGNVDKSRITSSMSLRFLYPEQQSWSDGHRSITCLIVDSSSDLTSSLLLANPSG